MSGAGSFRSGEMTAGNVGRFVHALDRQAEAGAIVALRRWCRERLNLVAGDLVVDVGCGVGTELVELAGLVGSGGRAVGVDANAAMVAQAATRTAGAANVQIVVGEASRLGLFEEGSVDAVVCERVLQHLEYSPADAVAEFRRVVTPAGRVALTDTDWPSVTVTVDGASAAEAELVASVMERAAFEFRENQAAGARLVDYCHAAGLEVVDSTSAVLTRFDPTLVPRVMEKMAAAPAEFTKQETAEVSRILAAAVAEETLRIDVTMHAVIARR